MNSVEKISAIFIALLILGGCIYGIYDIIIKIIKLLKEEGKKETGKIISLFIALLIVFVILAVGIIVFFNILLKNKYNIN